MIMRDNRTACRALRNLGATQEPHKVAIPKINMDCYPNLVVLGDVDELALQTKDRNAQKLYLNIHGAVEGSPTPGVDKKVLSSLSALIAGALTTATWDYFMTGFAACQAGAHPISKRELEKAFHWLAARTHHNWSNCQKMIRQDVEHYKAMKYLFDYG